MYRKCIGSDPTAARLDFALYEVAGEWESRSGSPRVRIFLLTYCDTPWMALRPRSESSCEPASSVIVILLPMPAPILLSLIHI